MKFSRTGARKLEQEVDALISASIRVGQGASILVAEGRHERAWRVDKIVNNDNGAPMEIWLSSERKQSLFDRWRKLQKRDFMRVSRHRGDVRRSLSTVAYSTANKVITLGFREEVGAPRISRSVATFQYPRPEATAWLHEHTKVS
jgi:hypothetical protein